MPDHPKYSVFFSDEDAEWVATIDEFPSLSWLAATPTEALAGLEAVVAEVRADMAAHG